MIQSWKEVLPGDRYEVRTAGLLYFYDQKIITCLYQPLIGIEATSLYFTFWQEKDSREGNFSATHHQLMGFMNLSLDRILKARKKLEAVGLLRSLKKKHSDPGFFIYRIFPPLKPDEFFHDVLLSPFLFHQVGSRDFERLSSLFADHSSSEVDFEDLSVTFDDVFESVPAGEIKEEEQLDPGEKKWEKRARSGSLRFRKPFDFKALKRYLSEAILPADALNDDVRADIEKLAFVYNTDPFDMSRAVETASLHTGTVDRDALRKEVRDFYRLEHGADEMPALYERTQPEEDREMAGRELQSEEERLIAWYETSSPYQLLEQLGHGSKPQPPDLRLIENLMFSTKLNPGVINVLIDYIVQVNHNNLNKSFVEKIAAQWSRMNVRTVRQAMSIAREERRKRQEPVSSKNDAPRRRVSERGHQEIVPEWMNGDGHVNRTEAPDEEAKKRAKWLDDYLNSI